MKRPHAESSPSRPESPSGSESDTFPRNQAERAQRRQARQAGQSEYDAPALNLTLNSEGPGRTFDQLLDQLGEDTKGFSFGSLREREIVQEPPLGDPTARSSNQSSADASSPPAVEAERRSYVSDPPPTPDDGGLDDEYWATELWANREAQLVAGDKLLAQLQDTVFDLQETVNQWDNWGLPSGEQRRPHPFVPHAEDILSDTLTRIERLSSRVSYLAEQIKLTRSEALQAHCLVPESQRGTPEDESTSWTPLPLW